MNNKKNRKGFTIVELSIVIAVIAILAVALIPAFGAIIDNSKKNALEKQLANAYAEYVLKAGGDVEENITIVLDDKYYTVEDGKADPSSGTGTAPSAADDKVVYCADCDVIWIYEAPASEGAAPTWNKGTAPNACSH